MMAEKDLLFIGLTGTMLRKCCCVLCEEASPSYPAYLKHLLKDEIQSLCPVAKEGRRQDCGQREEHGKREAWGIRHPDSEEWGCVNLRRGEQPHGRT